MSDIELKPCPFCSGEAIVHVNDGVKVICRECGVSSKCLVDGYSQGRPNGGAIKSVVKAWNTRRPMERIVEQLESKKIKHDINAESKIQWDLECCNAYNNGIADAIEIVKKEVRDE